MEVRRCVGVLGLLLVCATNASIAAEPESPPPMSIGVAAVDITPDYPVRLSGFGFRRTESEGVTQRIWAKALAVGSDGQGPAVLLVVDNVGVPDWMVEEVGARLKSDFAIPRERLAITFTHTHTAPMLRGVLPTLFGQSIPPEHQEHIDRYSSELTEKLIQVATAALQDRRPAVVSWGVGRVGFSKNRRTKGGPVDQDLPMLAVKDLHGKLRAIYVSYACHCVTLSNNRISGDWAGYAQEAIERNHPGAVALVSIGCGADLNPISGVTGDKVDVAAEQGAEIAAEVERLLNGFLAPINRTVAGRLQRFDLPLADLPTRDEWERRAKQGNYIGYHAQVQLDRLDRGERLKDHIRYSVQTWTFGDQLAMVFLPGEVVVDYALRLKRELDRSRLWINAYANDAPCYIPSERVLKEGGYEGASAMTYYDVPAPFRPGLEDKVIAAVHEQLPDTFKKPVDAGQQPGAAPLSPQQSGALIRTKPELVVELIAAEPLVADPVAIDFGPDGRMWVAEMHDYPAGLSGDYAPGGRIRVLTDSDGDGRYDASRVFLEGIPFPTGVKAWRKGVLICAAPDILYAEDADGEGAAEVRRVLYSGFGTHNYQARVNSLEYGLDNWIYGSCGLFGGQIASFAQKTSYPLGDRDFRIRPDHGEVESATGRTQQGRARDDWGNWFGCDNSNLARHYPLADHYVRRNPYVAPPAASVNVPAYAEPNRLHPLSESLQRFKLSGPSEHVTAACGLGVYRDELLGSEYSNNLFTCEPVNLVVHRLLLEPSSVSFKGRLADDEINSEFLASTDNWFRPVQARTGPDGTLYIVDMYRYVIEHPRWIPPETLGTLDVRAGQSLGRIYRVYPKAKPPRPVARLDKLDTPGLVAALDSPNGPQRDLAQQMLIWNGDKSAREPLVTLCHTATRPQTRLQALCTLDGLALLEDSEIAAALVDAHAGVRRHAIRLAESRFGHSPMLLDAVLRLVSDSDPQVRLQLACSLGEPNSPAASRALAEMLVDEQADAYLFTAVVSSVNERNVSDITRFALRDAGSPPVRAIDMLVRLAAAFKDRDAANRLVALIAKPSEGKFAAWQFDAMAALLNGLKRQNTTLARAIEAEQQLAADEMFRAAREIFGDQQADDGVRLASIKLIGAEGTITTADIERLAEQLVPRNSAALQAGIVSALGKLDQPAATQELLDRWNGYTPQVRQAALEAAMSRPTVVRQLLERMLDQRIQPSSIDASRRQTLLEHQNPEIRQLAAKAFSGATSSDRKQVVRDYQQAIAAEGNRENGKAVFAKRCSACHQLEGVGHAVGPDLAAITNKSPEFLLTSIFDPNQVVDGRYQQYRAIGEDGRTYQGVMAAESAVSITLKEQEGKQYVLLRNELETLAATGKSLMPEGLEKDISPADMSDLLAYLRPGPAYKQFVGNEPQIVKPRADGALALMATNCEIYGDQIIFEPQFRNLGYWHGENDCAVWTIELDGRGRYDVYLDAACDPISAGNAFVLEGADSSLRGRIASTGAWSEYRRTKLGTIALKQGTQRLTFRPDGPPTRALVDLRGIVLVAQGTPAPENAEAPQSTISGAAKAILDDARPNAEREAIIAAHGDESAALIAALADGIHPGNEQEEYRRIPWIWRVAIAAGRRARASEIRQILSVSLPRDDQPLRDWQAVVVGGGVINGITQAGQWPDELVAPLLKEDAALAARWGRAIELSSAMADNAKVRNGTRYDALRMVAMNRWEKAGGQLQKYLAQGVNDELQMGAVSGLGDMHSRQATAALIGGINHFSERNRALALDALLRNDERVAALLNALASGQISKEQLGGERTARLRKLDNQQLRERAQKVLAE